MRFHNERVYLIVCTFGMVLAMSGCATSSNHIFTWDENTISQKDLAEVLHNNPIGVDQNVRVTPLNTGEHSSVHLIQVRGAEAPHVHRTHDMTVFVVRGYGDMVIGKETKVVREGDAIHVPAGVRHYFTNRSLTPSVAIVVFSPPFDGKDTVPTE